MILEAVNSNHDSKFFSIKEVEEIAIKVLGVVKFARRNY